MRTRSIIPALLVLIAVLGGGCSDDTDGGADPTTTTAGPGDAPGAGFVDLPVLDADSPYVQGLCTIDFFAPADEEDPMAWVISEMRALPTTTPDEAREVEWMIERLERADELEDPLETDDLTSVAAVLRARCS